jgi:lipid A disaccharide synthetase
LSVKKLASVFLSAGEFSGDLLAADLAIALREKFGKIRIFGMTGSAMSCAGVESIASIGAA